ncbi:hypothetical protein [Gordonia rubripertincta]|uniref:hypothetical protein n=1 Tax=Gordonia rubripertincta TaxID=36822 RepID=UPI000B8D2438|nr:hypothetical protein [Gordonia rubripertincta]ASR02490.1 hypothetical protein GCWB2_08405 [Gordonia rubripertincta]QMU20402.1 hypothetical protein H3V45_20595 [Gordonia rubripertincta]TSD96887.1 hypothetical protein FOV72_09055 [Gordonia rubripertincta]
MRRSEDSLTALRADAQDGAAALTELLAAGRLMGVPVPDDASVRAGLRAVNDFDVTALSSDSRVLVSAHRAVAEQLHHLPEQRVRLDGWLGRSASPAIDAAVDHQRRAESDLYVLRTITDATSAAASGIDRLLRTFYLSVARLSAPSAAGTPPAELPQAVVTGRVPLDVAVEDIRSRVELFTTSVDATLRGIAGILDILNRSLDGIDDDPYPVETGEPPDGDFVTPPGAQPVESVRPQPVPAEPPTAPTETVRAARESGEQPEEQDIPFRLSGGPVVKPEVAHAVPGMEAAGAVEGRPASGPGGGSPTPTHVVADTRDGGTPPAGPATDATPERSAGDLALAGDQ